MTWNSREAQFYICTEDASSKLGSSHLPCSTCCNDDHCSHENHLHKLEAHIVRKLEQKEQSTSNILVYYTSNNYIFKLINCKKNEEYDSGARSVCPGRCTHNCQALFKYEFKVLKEEMNQWWGPAVTYVHRTALVYDDLKGWAIRREGGHHEVRWFIANKQVCRNFWLQARGNCICKKKHTLANKTTP